MNAQRLLMLLFSSLLVVGLVGCEEKLKPAKTEEEEAIAEIKKLRGHFEVDEHSPGKPVTVVSLRGKQLTDTVEQHLKGMTNLQELYLDSTPITGLGLDDLKGLNSLRSLSLRNTQITDAHINELNKRLKPKEATDSFQPWLLLFSA